MNLRYAVSFAALLFAVCTIAATHKPDTSKEEQFPPTYVPSGEHLYQQYCAACHGADAKGETPVGKKMGIKDLASADVQKMSDAELTTVIADGKNKMPSYKKSLKPDQIKELVGYIRSLKEK